MKNTSLCQVFLVMLVSFSSCNQANYDMDNYLDGLNGPYLGQKTPGDRAEMFAPGIVSNALPNRDITMTPDGREIYFCSSLGSYEYSTILVTRQSGGRWTMPEVAPFAADRSFNYFEPFISPDGRRLFFVAASSDPAEKNEDIYVMDNKEGTWSDPVNLGPPVNTEKPEFFPSVTLDGTLYFTRDDRQTGISTIYRSRLTDTGYTSPEEAEPQINAGVSRYNAYVAPDESYLIVPIYGYGDSFGGTDHYIVFRNPEGGWFDPVNLGPGVNSASRMEYSAYVSPDGKYLFFMSARFDREKSLPDSVTADDLFRAFDQPGNGLSDVYWISTDFFRELIPDE